MSASELFDLSLEIEGLLSLVMRREDMTPSEVYQLLSDKTARFAAGIGALVSQTGCEAASTSASRASSEREFVASLPSLPGLFDFDGATAADDAVVYATSDAASVDDRVVDSVEQPTDSVGDDAVDTCPKVVTEEADFIVAPEDSLDAGEAEAPSVETKEEAVTSGKAVNEVPSVSSTISVSSPGVSSTIKEDIHKAAKREPGDLRRMFTVNDKFRFRRELFGNSDTEFTDTLNLVEAMRNYSEAKDYFYTDLAWNPDTAEVQEFMAVIERYFTK